MDPHDALLRSEAERLGVDPEAVAEVLRMRTDRSAHPADEERPGRLTTREFSAVVLAGILDGPTELIAGRVMQSGEEVVFSPTQVRAAAVLGVRLRSCLDALLEDPEALAEARAVLLGDSSTDEGPAIDDEVLDGIPGAHERAQLGRRQAEAGETEAL
jgi:hypothetical protein